MSAIDPPSNKPIRTVIVQPSLARYRVPVYRELASRSEVDFRYWYGQDTSIPNMDPDGFAGEYKPMRLWEVAGQQARWHGAQLEAARCDDVDSVLLSWSSRYLSLGPAIRTAKRRGLGVVLWGHGYSRSENKLRRWARDRIARKADALLFYDRRTADAAIRDGWPADQVFVAPNAIDQAPITAATIAWTQDAGSLERFRREQGLEGRRVLLYVSRFTAKNRLPLLLEAVETVRRRMPDVLAVLVGGGELFEAIEQQVAQRGLEDHVRLLGPIYEEQQLAPWFLAAEAFVYPSAIGLSLLHAFGYGLPVVTDDALANHNPEIVAYQPDPDKQGANGLAYRAGDPEDFASVLHRLLEDSDLRARLAAGARTTVEAEYNVPVMVDGMVAAIRRSVA